MQQIAKMRDPAQFVTIGLDSEVFAFDVDQVREILDMQHISRVPNAPSFMAGMIDVRGQGVAVIDLRNKLGLTSTVVTQNTRIVVLEVPTASGLATMGVIADRVIEVTALSEHEMEAPPNVGVRWKSDYIRAISRSGKAFVIIFDLSRLFTSEDVALIDIQGD